jgi:hypothetical protein
VGDRGVSGRGYSCLAGHAGAFRNAAFVPGPLEPILRGVYGASFIDSAALHDLVPIPVFARCC